MYNKSTPESIQEMFGSIAKDYDRANTLFSFGMHKLWNRKLIRSIGGQKLLDLCAGTGEIAFGYLGKHPKAKAILLDFCPQMLSVAKKKGTKFEGRYTLIEADAQTIPLASRSIDTVTISYGIRNVKEPLKCFEEVARILKPGGQFAILELTRPRFPFLRFAHKHYLRFVLPFLGKLAAKNGEAYRYLSNSIETFVSPEDLEKKMEQAGLQPIQKKYLTGGLATILISSKPHS